MTKLSERFKVKLDVVSYRFVLNSEEGHGLEKSVQYLVRNYKKGDEADLARILGECFSPITVRHLKQRINF